MKQNAFTLAWFAVLVAAPTEASIILPPISDFNVIQSPNRTKDTPGSNVMSFVYQKLTLVVENTQDSHWVMTTLPSGEYGAAQFWPQLVLEGDVYLIPETVTCSRE